MTTGCTCKECTGTVAPVGHFRARLEFVRERAIRDAGPNLAIRTELPEPVARSIHDDELEFTRERYAVESGLAR